jgi:branched-chain amino acid transport system ATP-binding protein
LLKERRKQLAQSMSGGEQQILAMARGLMAWPTLLMLDEPFLGLAPKVVAEMVHTIRRVHQEGVTILFTEQNIRQSLVISQRGYIVEHGEMVLSGSQQELLEHQELKTVYLGI